MISRISVDHFKPCIGINNAFKSHAFTIPNDVMHLFDDDLVLTNNACIKENDNIT